VLTNVHFSQFFEKIVFPYNYEEKIEHKIKIEDAFGEKWPGVISDSQQAQTLYEEPFGL
jgi:hypothetical protein